MPEEGVLLEQKTNEEQETKPEPSISVSEEKKGGLRQVKLREFYQREIDNLRLEKVENKVDPWKIIEKIAEQKEKKREHPQTPEIPHKFSATDKLRYQALMLQARFEGVKDLRTFQRLVEHFESTITETESKYIKIPKGLTKEQEEAIIKDWQEKGYRLDTYGTGHDRNKYIERKLERDIPIRIESGHIKIIKDFLGGENDPVAIIKGLQKLGISFQKSSLEYPERMKKVAELIKSTNSVKGLDIASQISNWDYKWFNPGRTIYVSGKLEEGSSQFDFLIELSKSQNPESILSPEICRKVDLLSKASNKSINLANLESFKRIIDNPKRLEFLATILRGDMTSYSSDYWRIPFDRYIESLDDANVLDPLLTLLKNGFYIKDVAELFNYRYGSDNASVEKTLIQQLGEIVNKPEVQSFIQDKERLEFAGLYAKTTGSSYSIDYIPNLDKKFQKRFELVYLAKLFNADRGDYYSKRYRMEAIENVANNPKLLKTVTSEEFSAFMQVLQSKIGYQLDDHFHNLSLDNRSRLIELFENVKLRKGLMQDTTQILIRTAFRGQRFDISRAEFFIDLSNKPNMLSAVSALSEAGFNLADRDQCHAKVLEQIASSPEILGIIQSEDFKNLAKLLDGELKWGKSAYEFNELLSLYSDKEFLKKIHDPKIIERIKKIRPHGLMCLKDIQNIINLDPQMFDLVSQLVEQFDFRPLFKTSGEIENKEILDKVLNDEDLKAKLLSEQTINTFKRLNKEFYYYALQPEHILSLASAPEDFVDFIKDLKEKYKYNYQTTDIPLLVAMDISSNKENSLKVLDALSKAGYQFKMQDWVAHIGFLGKVADSLPITLSNLEEALGYKFKIEDSFNLANVAQQNFTKERFIQLKKVYEKYKDQYTGLSLELLLDLPLIETNEDMIKKLAEHGFQFNILQINSLKPFFLMSDKDHAVEAWLFMRNLSPQLQDIFRQQMWTSENLGALSMEKLQALKNIYQIIGKSPSKEIRKLQDQIVGQLLTVKNPEEVFQQIRSVFEFNNLPVVGKIYKVFEIIHPYGSKVLDEIFQRKRNLSPVLTDATNPERYGIIYRDLLRVHIESGNPSLYAYLKSVKDGESIIQKLNLVGLDQLTPLEKTQLSRFLDRLGTLQANSTLGKRKINYPKNDENIETRLEKVKKDLGVKNEQTITDRISEMFIRSAGFGSLDEVILRMEEALKEADQRNRELVQQAIETNEGKITLNPGDLLKGVQDKFLDFILQNGSVAKEYLGASAGSDATPFDTDTNMILEGDLTEGVASAVDNSVAKNYGNLLLVIRDREQFQKEKVKPFPYDRTKYEIFSSGVVGNRHFGVRTGFPATEIDMMIVKEPLSKNTDKLNRIFFTIAQNGFYIPVIDIEGKVIFAPEDFENYKMKPDKIMEAIISEKFKPQKLIDALKQSSFAEKIFESPTGVWEGYNLEKHTLMVIGQFEKYFSAKFSSPLISKENFRLLLALHDFGKPIAQKAEGKNAAQHEYTQRFILKILTSLNLNQQDADIITAITTQDYIGKYMQGQLTAEQSSEMIKEKALELGVPVRDLFELFQLYYMCDAGSYTEDAGGKKALDNLFEFIHGANGENEIKFSKDTQLKVNDLLDRLVLVGV